jgi:hypothetical protein
MKVGRRVSVAGLGVFIMASLILVGRQAGGAEVTLVNKLATATSPYLQEAATQHAGDLEVSLYPTLTGRPRVGDNQFEVKLAERQGQPVSPAAVEVAYGMGRVEDENRIAIRPEGYGIFSTVLRFPQLGTWNVEVFVRRPGHPEVKVPFRLNVD